MLRRISARIPAEFGHSTLIRRLWNSCEGSRNFANKRCRTLPKHDCDANLYGDCDVGRRAVDGMDCSIRFDWK